MTTLQDTEGESSELEAIEHPAGPSDDAECSVYFIPIDATNLWNNVLHQADGGSLSQTRGFPSGPLRP